MTIRWTKLSVADLTRICDYTEVRFGQNQAHTAANAIYEAVNSLESMPNRGRVGRKSGTRELPIVGLPFLAVYEVDAESIRILRVIHGAQKWP